jgi:hypothetical protein
VALVVLASVAVVAPARAAPWAVTFEAGLEVDTNVERVETGPGLDNTPVTAPVIRLGARVERRGRVLGGGYSIVASDLTRLAIDPGDHSEVRVESVTLLAADARWLHPISDRSASAGFALIAADAEPLADPVGARTFRNLGADLLLALKDGDDRRLVLALGPRAFSYKPDHSYDWYGPAASARLDATLWRDAVRSRSLELATTLGFEARYYASSAFANACAPGAPPDPSCFAGTDVPRRDRFSRVGAELTYVGAWVWTLGYQLAVIDSNSFGQSLVRHRAIASATVELGARFYVTGLAILQADIYTDGLVVPSDPNHVDFTNIEDENRSSLQVQLARKITPTWSVELRATAWRNLAGDTMHLAFARELVYLGLVYAR